VFFVFQQPGLTGGSAGSFSAVYCHLVTGYCSLANARGLVLTGLKIFFHLYYYLKVIVLFKVPDLMMLKSKIKLRKKNA
jgi:hypothetical protein